MRRASTEAVEAMYTLVDPAVVSGYASYATGPEAVSPQLSKRRVKSVEIIVPLLDSWWPWYFPGLHPPPQPLQPSIICAAS